MAIIQNNARTQLHLIFSLCVVTTLSLYQDSRGAEPESPCPIKADLWLLGGQSNMGAYGKVEHPAHLDPRRVLCFRLTNQWAEALEPLGWHWESADPVHRLVHIWHGGKGEDFDQTARRGIKRSPDDAGIGTAFAQKIIENSDHNIGLIPCSHGGVYIYKWDPALKDQGGESLYGSMMHRAGMVGGKIKGLIWYQGENDCSDDYAVKYEAALLNFFDCVRRDLNQPELPIIYAQLSCYYPVPKINDKAWERVREIQRHVASLRKNVYVVSAIDLPMGDGMHLNGESAQRLGWRMGEIALTEVYHKAGHAKPISLESIKVLGRDTTAPIIKLHFGGVSGRLRASGRPADFELRFANHNDGDLLACCFRTDFDPDDPAGLILHVCGAIKEPAQLVYGAGPHPYCNIVDEKDIAVPAIGPIDLPMD